MCHQNKVFQPNENKQSGNKFIILAARVLVKYIPSMELFKHVVYHSDHHSEEMSKISEQVCALELLYNVTIF